MSEELFEHIEDQIDENGWDFDCQFAGNVLTIEAADGTQITSTATRPIRNCGLPQSGGYHFAEQKRQMVATARRTGISYDVLNEALERGFGRSGLRLPEL